MILRSLQPRIETRLFKGKAILLFGPRRVGKSTLAEHIIARQTVETMHLSGDDADVRDILTSTKATRLKALVGNKKLLFIDEAPRSSRKLTW